MSCSSCTAFHGVNTNQRKCFEINIEAYSLYFSVYDYDVMNHVCPEFNALRSDTTNSLVELNFISIVY